jgi:hypothetical protein
MKTRERSVQKGHIPPITYKLISVLGYGNTTRLAAPHPLLPFDTSTPGSSDIWHSNLYLLKTPGILLEKVYELLLD